MILRVLGVLLMWVTAVQAATREDVEFVVGSSLPPEVWDALSSGNAYAVEARLNPFYLQGDFDGDGWRDTAVLVKERASGKHGIAFVFKGAKVRIIGAGKDTGDGTDNLDWMDAWYVERKGKVTQGATDEAPPAMKGDSLMVIKTESASALIWWEGKRFRWYQQGD